MTVIKFIYVSKNSDCYVTCEVNNLGSIQNEMNTDIDII